MKFTNNISAATSRWAHRAIVSCVLVSMALLWVGKGSSLYSAAPTEYQLKAVFLMNFAKFVEWPATALRPGQSALTICVLGEDPFGHDLDDAVRGQTAADRAIAVRRISQISREETCHVLFVSSPERERAERALATVRNAPVLTVSEGDDFVVAGGIIALVIEDNKVRFDINLDAAEHAGLKVSSKLLKLARNVRERRRS